MKENNIISFLFNLYRENKLAHAYLIETDNIERAYDDILRLIKMINCPHTYKPDCEECNLCHLTDFLLLPSLFTISPEGKMITKDAIENLKKAFIMAPIYTKNNVYIIKEAEKMNDSSYNKILKFLEEPVNNVLGFFITTDTSKIAPTIYSRLELIKMRYNAEETYSEKIVAIANKYFDIICEDIEKGIWYNSSVLINDIEERGDFIKLFNLILQKSLECNSFKLSKIITKYLNEMNYNANMGLLLDSFIIEVGELYGK